MKTNTITARFGGREVMFAIDPAHLPLFEVCYGSAIAHYRALLAQNWTLDSVKSILNFATAGSAVLDRIQKPVAGIGISSAAKMMIPIDRHVADVLADRHPAPYSLLAQLILGAALFGLDEKDATFSDEPANAQSE